MSARLVVLALALVSAGPVAVAQERGTRIPGPEPARPKSDNESVADAQQVMNAYAACTVKRSRRGVEAYLRIIPGTDPGNQTLLKLVSADCLYDAELRFKAKLFRGGAFESLYRTDFKRVKSPDFSAVPPIDYAAGVGQPVSDDTKIYLGVIDFADCVARAQPAAARELIFTAVATSKEATAFAKLMPSFKACLSEGVALTFSKPVLRGYVAEALYRLSVAQAASPSPATLEAVE